jgi:ribosomal protein L40E
MKRLLPGIAVLFILFPLLTQCDVSHKRPGEQAQIPASAQTITISGVTWSDVAFQHAQHSDRYKGMCIKCHDHQPIAGQTHWYCRKCHTAGQDREKLCTAVAQHGCIMTQCYNCHEVKGANPGLTCMDCHKGGVNLVPGPQPGGAPTMVLTGSIDQQSEVDHWILNFPTSGNIIIDVQAWESCGSNGNKPNIPRDFFGDGEHNNQLHAEIYLFKEDGALLNHSNYSCDDNMNCAPGAHSTRTGQSPYLAMNINAGTYRLAIGCTSLSEADAWAKINNVGSSWTNFDDVKKITLYNKYKINIYFQNP